MKHFLLGSLSGIVLGGIYGLLKTPRSGKENQEVMKEYIDDTTYHVQDVSERVKDLKSAINNLTDEGKKLQEGFVQDVQKIADEYMYEAEPRLRRIQEKAEKMTKDIEVTTENIQQVASK
jgi:gas vesicle protein